MRLGCVPRGKEENAPQGSHCGGIENDTSYPAAGGEYAFTRILSCLRTRT